MMPTPSRGWRRRWKPEQPVVAPQAAAIGHRLLGDAVAFGVGSGRGHVSSESSGRSVGAAGARWGRGQAAPQTWSRRFEVGRELIARSLSRWAQSAAADSGMRVASGREMGTGIVALYDGLVEFGDRIIEE